MTPLRSSLVQTRWPVSLLRILRLAPSTFAKRGHSCHEELVDSSPGCSNSPYTVTFVNKYIVLGREAAWGVRTQNISGRL